METTDINVLLRALPISGIRARVIGTVGGVPLFEPPAGQAIPYVNPEICGDETDCLREWQASEEGAGEATDYEYSFYSDNVMRIKKVMNKITEDEIWVNADEVW
ncbi:MAG: hypothetical protein HZB33_08500 [Nitrospirae bacterium]|nr:hypothetical protein [Nitrospirota bacterium]